MTCEPIKLEDGSVAILCGRGRRSPRCRCGNVAQNQCDYPAGKGTCDRHLCGGCRTRVGDDLDYCPDHAGQGTLPGLMGVK